MHLLIDLFQIFTFSDFGSSFLHKFNKLGIIESKLNISYLEINAALVWIIHFIVTIQQMGKMAILLIFLVG